MTPHPRERPARCRARLPAERRGRQPPSTATPSAATLTTGKLNAVRAAFKAGVKPSAIARQFGISQSDVRKVLATEGRDRKSGR